MQCRLNFTNSEAGDLREQFFYLNCLLLNFKRKGFQGQNQAPNLYFIQ